MMSEVRIAVGGTDAGLAERLTQFGCASGRKICAAADANQE
jgi:hypothetical protein